MNIDRIGAIMLAVLLAFSATVLHAAGILPDQPILYVTQVPTPDNTTNVGSTFGNHEGTTTSAPRGGDLMIRYVDGSVKNLTAAAGLGASGFQDATSIAVRQPAVHWSGTKAVFSMVVGSSASAADTTPYFWQLYEITGFGQGQTPVITKVSNQPANCNCISPCYGTDEHIIFICDRARNGAQYLFPQRDEYRLDTTNTGLWNLDPSNGNLFLMSHNPSGSFWPSIDSYGRVIFTRWDHLERDVTADADTMSKSGSINGTFNFSDETSAAQIIPRQDEAFPEPSPVRTDLIAGTNEAGFEFNQFFPWTINEDGTGEETINHIGRHELRFAVGKTFTDDPNLVNFSALTDTRFNPNFINNMLQIREDPAHPGIYFGVDANEFGTHAAGQIYSLNGPLGLPADQMKVTYLTDRTTEGVTAEGGNPNPNHSGHYRNPVPFANGALVAAHTLETHADLNTGTVTNPASRYAFRIKSLMQSGAAWVSDQTLTTGTTKTVSYYAPAGLITYSGALWKLDPVAVVARTKPVANSAALAAPEQAIFDQESVNVAAFKAYMASNNFALIVSRNLTTRDKADKQQPFNLKVDNSTVQTVVTSGKVYDIASLQIFQADQLRGLTGSGTSSVPLPGRRPIPVPMHDPAVSNPPNPGGPAGSVKINPLDGSMAAFVPVRRAMTWQMTDANSAPVVRERYWLTFQPGEIRTCTSCHGINSVDQASDPTPQNSPEALRDLLKFYKASTAQGPGSVAFSSATYSVSENGGTATIYVALTGGAAGAVAVSYATSDGSAAAGTKYTAASGTLNWADGDSATKTFTVSITDNQIMDGDKTVNLTLSNPTNTLTLGAQSTAVLTIVDDDVPASSAGSVQFSSAMFSVAEDGGTATISITRTGGSTGAVSVNYATSDGTAAAVAKYTAASGVLNWADGDSAAKTFTVSITDNLIVDGDKTVNLTLSTPTNSLTLGAQLTAVLTIVDNDVAPPAVQITSGPTALPNPATVNTSVSITCAATGAAPVTIAWDFGDGSTLPAGASTSVNHTFTQAGVYTIKATAADGNSTTATAQTSITINALPVPKTLTISRASLHFNFKTHGDLLTLTGTLPLGAAFSASGQATTAALGGFSTAATLNGSKRNDVSLQLKKAPRKNTAPDAPVPFTLTVKNMNLFTPLAASGFTNADIKKPVAVPGVSADITIAGTVYHAAISFSYTAKMGVKGVGKK